jgi:anti-sigma B factor antagonist
MPTKPPSPWFQVNRVGEITVVTFLLDRIMEVEAPYGKELAQLGEVGIRRLVLNFAGVERLDSHIVAVIIRLHKKLTAAGGRLGLCRINPGMYKTFETLKLPRLLHIYGDEQEAVQALGPGPGAGEQAAGQRPPEGERTAGRSRAPDEGGPDKPVLVKQPDRGGEK